MCKRCLLVFLAGFSISYALIHLLGMIGINIAHMMLGNYDRQKVIYGMIGLSIILSVFFLYLASSAACACRVRGAKKL